MEDFYARKKFWGLTQAQLNDLAKNSPRGESARISENGENLLFTYRSRSGKQKGSRWYSINDDGDLTMQRGYGPYEAANAPRFFYEAVEAAHNKLSN